MEFDIVSIVENIRGGTLLGISGMTFLSNMFPGLPEELFLILVGYVVGLGNLKWWLAYIVLATPLTISDNIIYFLARGGNKFVMAIQKKIIGDSLEKNMDMFVKRRGILLFGSRFLFHFRVVGLAVAGITKMPWKNFFIVDFFAVSAFVNLMLLVGVFLRYRFVDIKDGVGIVQDIMSLVFVVALCIIAFFVFKKYLKTWLRHIGNFTEKSLTFMGITIENSDEFLEKVSDPVTFVDNDQPKGDKS